ncbi:MAG: hypothetical protein MRY23_05190 [Pelagibacteraceae bacterium]|nr:hypothetical protein [Pelagibacteraceae bacterium]MCI5079025.1 hypothetical protein [Pelagibacteraceae bacterium]
MNNFKNFRKLIIIGLIFFQCDYAHSEDFFEIEAEKFQYLNNNKTIVATGNAIAKNKEGTTVSSDKIIYHKEKKLIETFNNSKYQDGKNILTAVNFKYDINLKTVEANKNVILIDNKKNKYRFSFFKYFELKENGYGEDSKVNFADGSYLEAAEINTNNKNQITKLNNANYTTCSKIKNKNKEFCPTWSLKSKEVIHDKKKGLIKHKNSFLKIKNIPILYSPYISHPDPSVKRKSGFLPPLIKSISNLGRTIRTPYFWAISDDKDLTLTPVYYFNEKNSIQASYRQVFKNSFLNLETGYSGGYKKFNKTGRTKGSRNYLFAEYNKNFNKNNLDNNQINLKIQRISQENFVRVNKINTKLFKEDIRTLENSLKISSYKNTKRLEMKAGIFENLNISDTEKYTYYFPDGLFSNSFDKFENFKINYTNYFQGRKFSKDQKQFKIRNLLNLESKLFPYKKIGLGTQLKANIFNKNIYNDNVTGEKDNTNVDNYLTLALNNSLPLVKFNNNSYQTLTPKIFIKYTTGSMQNALQNEKILNYADIYSMNRTNNLDLPEVGSSMGHGIEYSYKRKSKLKNNSTIYSLTSGIGQVIRSNRLDNMPIKSSLNNSSSDFAGFAKFSFFGDENIKINKQNNKINFLNYFEKDFIEFNYKYNLDNNLKKLNRNNISLNSNFNNFNFSLAYDEKNNHIGNDRSGLFNLKTLLKKNYYLGFESKKNLLTNKSEYLNFSLNYENDCIVTALTLSKEFYNDKDLTNSKTLILSIIIKPFSDSFAPDLTNFIN